MAGRPKKFSPRARPSRADRRATVAARAMVTDTSLKRQRRRAVALSFAGATGLCALRVEWQPVGHIEAGMRRGQRDHGGLLVRLAEGAQLPLDVLLAEVSLLPAEHQVRLPRNRYQVQIRDGRLGRLPIGLAGIADGQQQ